MIGFDLSSNQEDVPPVRQSVHCQGEFEALVHKWIESEKAGFDLGNAAICCWIRLHWKDFLRAKWLEHLHGRAFWIELDHDDFGLLNREFHGSTLIAPIVEMLKNGEENLEILNWAIDERKDIVEILQILDILDINSRRVECQICKRLSQAC